MCSKRKPTRSPNGTSRANSSAQTTAKDAVHRAQAPIAPTLNIRAASYRKHRAVQHPSTSLTPNYEYLRVVVVFGYCRCCGCGCGSKRMEWLRVTSEPKPKHGCHVNTCARQLIKHCVTHHTSLIDSWRLQSCMNTIVQSIELELRHVVVFSVKYVWWVVWYEWLGWQVWMSGLTSMNVWVIFVMFDEQNVRC